MTQPAVAVTGATGRLGSALIAALAARGIRTVAIGREKFDLDAPEAANGLTGDTDSELLIHCAAWTDVDACAREPELAMRRNGDASGELADACARSGKRMVLISTNEVFDGQRRDGSGYSESDDPRPINAYGASKLRGEELASAAFARANRVADLAIVRTAWLFGPPPPDFPARILAAADRLPPDEPLPLVSDEYGSPTLASDLAAAIVELTVEQRAEGVFHLVNDGIASRLDYGRAVLDVCRPGRQTRAISRTEFTRASTPPAWAVLDSSRARARGIVMRPWRPALDEYLAAICRT